MLLFLIPKRKISIFENRRKYFSGWCQFIKLAKAMNGYVIKFPNSEQGVEVDVIAYKKDSEQPYEIDMDEGLIEVGADNAIGPEAPVITSAWNPWPTSSPHRVRSYPLRHLCWRPRSRNVSGPSERIRRSSERHRRSCRRV